MSFSRVGILVLPLRLSFLLFVSMSASVNGQKQNDVESREKFHELLDTLDTVGRFIAPYEVSGTISITHVRDDKTVHVETNTFRTHYNPDSEFLVHCMEIKFEKLDPIAIHPFTAGVYTQKVKGKRCLRFPDRVYKVNSFEEGLNEVNVPLVGHWPLCALTVENFPKHIPRLKRMRVHFSTSKNGSLVTHHVRTFPDMIDDPHFYGLREWTLDEESRVLKWHASQCRHNKEIFGTGIWLETTWGDKDGTPVPIQFVQYRDLIDMVEGDKELFKKETIVANLNWDFVGSIPKKPISKANIGTEVGVKKYIRDGGDLDYEIRTALEP
jgi:hypothetical protein